MEILNDIGELLSKFPELAIWILAGVLFYKTVVIGSIFAVIKLLIEKLFSAFQIWTNQPTDKRVQFADDFITTDGTFRKFCESLQSARKSLSAHSIISGSGFYHNEQHVKFFTNVIDHAVEREIEEHKKKRKERLANSPFNTNREYK